MSDIFVFTVYMDLLILLLLNKEFIITNGSYVGTQNFVFLVTLIVYDCIHKNRWKVVCFFSIQLSISPKQATLSFFSPIRPSFRKLMTLCYNLTSHLSKHTLEPIIEPTFCHLCQRKILIWPSYFPKSDDIVLLCRFLLIQTAYLFPFIFKLDIFICHANLLSVSIWSVQNP